MSASIRMRASWALACGLVFGHGARAQETPAVADERLELILFAEEPELMTPTGLAVDEQGGVFVLESHTHHPPEGYPGPSADRVLVFHDHDGDGRADSRSVFAEGIEQGMNLAWSPDGDLLVMGARTLWKVSDEDGDGRGDGLRVLLRLETTERYAHNSWMGVTVAGDGWLYGTRGNTGSRAWAIEGKDGSRIQGYGDGGNVFRCRLDGTQVEEIATGFWNPFQLKFDVDGRLLLVDNDPDARGPNRLIQVILGGDYGYQSVYGGSGTHPFQGWDGTLPGTLGYVAGIGEAPCDLIDGRRLAFGVDYDGAVLTSIWNENAIDVVAVDRSDFGLTSKGVRRLVSGGTEFRPVALEAGPNGALYITDWVRVNYPNHGRGRLWTLRARASAPHTAPSRFPSSGQLEPQVGATPSEWSAVLADNPWWAGHVVARRLAQPENAGWRAAWRRSNKAIHRRVATVAAMRAGDGDIDGALRDLDPEVRRVALRWAGESGETAWRPRLRDALRVGAVDGTLLESFLAAHASLDPEFAAALGAQSFDRSNQIPRPSVAALRRELAQDTTLSAAARRAALRGFDQDDREALRPWLLRAFPESEGALRSEWLAQLAQLSGDEARDLLIELALEPEADLRWRCDAVAALGDRSDSQPARWFALLRSPHRDLRIETARALASVGSQPRVAAALQEARESTPPEERALREALAMALFGPTPANPLFEERPESLEAWVSWTAQGGDPDRGRRVFRSPRSLCIGCHAPSGTVDALGPDLSGLSRSTTRAGVVHSILRPSDSFAPQYQAWRVDLIDGTAHIGLQLDHKSGGAIELLTLDRTTRRFEAASIRGYAAMPASLMPPGLESALTKSAFRDLVAYLSEPPLQP